MAIEQKSSRAKSKETSDSPNHLSGELHATGHSRFICDESKPVGLCIVKPVGSPHARAAIRSIDTQAAKALPGVVCVLTSADVPGENQIGAKIKDQPLLPDRMVNYIGQPVALVVAESDEAAIYGCALVKIEYDPLEPVTTIADAVRMNSLIAPELLIQRGDIEAGLAKAAHVLEGSLATGSQEHVYFETQRARAIPGEDHEITIYASTQAPSEIQEVAARILGVDRKDITVDVKRLGGGFGGKESIATLWGCLAALACWKSRRPVELKLSRAEDMKWTGKRHPFESKYRVGFDDNGRILAYDIELNANGGAFADLTMAILQRAMLHADNAYYIPKVRILGRALRTNLPPNTAFRGFGAPQGIFVIETILQRMATLLGKDPLEIRRRNAYKEDQKTPFGQPVHEATGAMLLQRLGRKANYRALRREFDEFNGTQRFVKRGMAVVPVKFGISFTSPFLNQGAALVQVYADGSASVSHGGVEMGQELNTRIGQIVAGELGIPLDRIRVESTNTKRVANTSPTAASTGADLNGRAALDAARQISGRLKVVAAAMLRERTGHDVAVDRVVLRNGGAFASNRPRVQIPISDLCHQAWFERVDLAAHGFYKTPRIQLDWSTGKGTPFAYFVNGCALVAAEVDVLTGMFRLLRTHIVHETGTPVNPAVDRGQIEGAFMQGMGWCTIEEVVQDSRGRNLTESLTTYKIPTLNELPEVFEVEMITDSHQFAGVLGSKAVGEPPLIYGEAAFFAIRDAVEAVSAHQIEASLSHPATPEAILRAVEEQGRGGRR